MIYKNKNKLFGRLLKNLNKQPSISFEMRDLKFVFVFTFCTFLYTKQNEEKYKPNMNKKDNNTKRIRAVKWQLDKNRVGSSGNHYVFRL